MLESLINDKISIHSAIAIVEREIEKKKEPICEYCGANITHISGSIYQCKNGHKLIDTLDGKTKRKCSTPLCNNIVIGNTFLCNDCIELDDDSLQLRKNGSLRIDTNIIIFSEYISKQYNTKISKKEIKIKQEKEIENKLSGIMNYIEKNRKEYVEVPSGKGETLGEVYHLDKDEIEMISKMENTLIDNKVKFEDKITLLNDTIKMIMR